MMAVVDIVYPMLGMIVAAEWLRILERLPSSVDQLPCRVILDFIQYSVQLHNFCYLMTVPSAVDIESNAIQNLNKRFRCSQCLT